MSRFLNDDCLFNVFFHAIQAPVLSDGNPLKLCDLAPLNLAAVCRSWNVLVMRNPVLWSHIHICTPSHAHQTGIPIHPSLLRFVKIWLQKSEKTSLSVSLDIFGTKENHVYRDLISLLFSEQERWREVYVDVSNLDRMAQKPTVVRCSPSLTSFTLTLPLYGGSTEYAVLLDLTSCVFENEEKARLALLDISGPLKWALPSRQETLHLPNLNELDISVDLRHELDATLAVLSATPNLVTLHLYDQAYRNMPISRCSTQHIIILPKLVNLHLSISGPFESKASLELVGKLSCAFLLKFAYQNSQSFPILPEHLCLFASFISRHFPHQSRVPPPLVELKLYTSSLEPANFISPETHDEYLWTLLEMLHPLHHLRRLSLVGLVVNERFIEELTPVPLQTQESEHSNGITLCPALSELSIWSFAQLSAEKVEDMLVSRAKIGKALTKVKIRSPGFLGFERKCERVRELVEDGLEVL